MSVTSAAWSTPDNHRRRRSHGLSVNSPSVLSDEDIHKRLSLVSLDEFNITDKFLDTADAELRGENSSSAMGSETAPIGRPRLQKSNSRKSIDELLQESQQYKSAQQNKAATTPKRLLSAHRYDDTRNRSFSCSMDNLHSREGTTDHTNGYNARSNAFLAAVTATPGKAHTQSAAKERSTVAERATPPSKLVISPSTNLLQKRRVLSGRASSSMSGLDLTTAFNNKSGVKIQSARPHNRPRLNSIGGFNMSQRHVRQRSAAGSTEFSGNASAKSSPENNTHSMSVVSSPVLSVLGQGVESPRSAQGFASPNSGSNINSNSLNRLNGDSRTSMLSNSGNVSNGSHGSLNRLKGGGERITRHTTIDSLTQFSRSLGLVIPERRQSELSRQSPRPLPAHARKPTLKRFETADGIVKSVSDNNLTNCKRNSSTVAIPVVPQNEATSPRDRTYLDLLLLDGDEINEIEQKSTKAHLAEEEEKEKVDPRREPYMKYSKADLETKISDMITEIATTNLELVLELEARELYAAEKTKLKAKQKLLMQNGGS